MKKIVYLVLCLILHQAALAQDFNFRTDRYSQKIWSKDLFGVTFTMPTTTHSKWDEITDYPSRVGTKYKFKSVEDIIRVGIDHDTMKIIPAYRYLLHLTIDGYNYATFKPGPSSYTRVTKIIELNYNPDSLKSYNDLVVFREFGFHAIGVQLTGVDNVNLTTGSITPMSSGLASNFYVEAEVAVQRYDLMTKKIVVRRDLEPGNRSLKVTWGVFDGPSTPCVLADTLYSEEYKPVSYELEWCYIDDYQYNLATGAKSNSFASGGTINYDFRRNSTRVQITEGRNFKIPLLYERGAIIYRVRTLRPSSVNYNDIQYGDWTLADFGTVDASSSCFPSQGYVLLNAHSNDSLNWQYTVNFAEDGKYKHVVNYFDGSLKDRQTQTRVNTDKDYIIAVDKVYDYEGRPSIVSLPTPVKGQSDLFYRKDILLNKATNNPYRAQDFDFLGCSLPDSISLLSDNSMAHKYYSPLNPDKSGMQQFVPDAKGFPFVQTIYYPDNTNKVLMQGGAGREQQLWKDHATKYEYTRPLQQDVDRLKGTEAGNAQYYPKQIVTDPNGQSSFSILDPAGRVVISGLQGPSPDTSKIPIDTLANFIRGKEVCQNLLLDYKQEKNRNSLYTALPFYNDVICDATFTYSVKTFPYLSSCTGQYLWVPANYEVSVANDCGTKVTSATGDFGQRKATATNGNSYTKNAFSAIGMKKGRYIANKKVSFSEYDIHHLADSFVFANEPSCFYDVNYFIKKAIDSADFPCQKGADSNGSFCDMAKKQMILDMTPGGKYGKYIKNEDSTFKAGVANSIFSLSGKTRTRYRPILETGRKFDGSYIAYGDGDKNWQYSCDSSDYSPAVSLTSLPASAVEVRSGCDYTRNDWFFRAVFDIEDDVNLSNLVYQKWSQYGDSLSFSVNGVGKGRNRWQNLDVYPGLSGTSMHAATGFVHGTNQLDLHIFDVAPAPQIWASFKATLAERYEEPIYYYQDDCITLPSSVTKDGKTYTNLKELPVETFISIFNEKIAEALLPIHPEYCKLQNCNGGGFEDSLEATKTIAQALENNMFKLDSLIAHDPLQIRGGSSVGTKLAHFQNVLNTRLDTFALQQAYCAAGNSIEMEYCIAKNYKYEIDHFIFTDDVVKQRYFDYLKSLYIGNRTYIKQRMLDGAGSSCSPCGDIRLTIVGIPNFPSLDDAVAEGDGGGSGSVPGSGSTDDDLGSLPEWMKEKFRKAMDGDTSGMYTTPDSLKVLYDETTVAANVESQAEAFMNHLKNCPIGEPDRTAMRTSIANILKSGTVLTPEIIRSVLVDTFSLPLSDLCHPFLIAYPVTSGDRQADASYACEEDNLYTGFLSFLKRPQVVSELTTAPSSGSPSALTGSASFALDGSNAFEGQFGSSATVTAYTESMGTWCTDCFTTLIVSGTSKTDTFNFSSRKFGDPGIQANLASTMPTYTIQAVRCLNSDESAIATGSLARSTTIVDLRCSFCLVPQSFYVWGRHTAFMKDAPSVSSLKNALTCVDIKKGIEDFNAEQSSYGYSPATNHPLYQYTITNYLNHKFNKSFGISDYDGLMNGCAVTDQVAMKKIIAGYRVELNSDADAETFISAMLNFDTEKPSYLRYKTASGKPVLLVDFNSIAEDRLLQYKNLLDGAFPIAMGTVISRSYNYSLADDNTSLIFAHSSCSFAPSSFGSVYSTVSVSIWEAGAYRSNYNLHSVRLNSGASAKQEADMISNINTYLHSTTLSSSPTCNTGYHYFGRDLKRSADYGTTLKQEYLAYVYSLSTYTHDGVIAGIDPSSLGSHISSYGTATFTYDDPYCDGRRNHVYAYNPSPSPLPSGYDLAKNTILSSIGSTLFPDKDFTYITALGTRLAVIRKASGEYWYRYFDANNKLYNLYINPPASGLGILPKDFSFSVSSVKMGPHPNTFYVDVTKGAKTVRCSGHADFPLGNSIYAENVILDQSAAANCLDSIDCEYEVLARAKENGKAAYHQYFDSVVTRISNDMMVHLLNTTKDTLIYCGQQQQYQQTLYYYDLAGNLTRTVPPAGVTALADAIVPSVNTNRNGTAPDNKMTAHKKVSTYTYNSLNQLTYQNTPDGGTAYFFYDAMGRQIFSQNSKQRPGGMYTYNLYDSLGRPMESGEVKLGCEYFATSPVDFDTTYCTFYLSSGTSISAAHPHFVTYSFDENTYSYSYLTSLIRGKERKNVVYTAYDYQTSFVDPVAGEMMGEVQNTRNRVSSIKFMQTVAPGTSLLTAEPTFATYYAYDISGNVRTIVYDYPKLVAYDQRYKMVDYDYDLVSGKVNMVSYNRGMPDQFYQQYDYDADNRITKVNTSNDGIIWNRDASYTYYKHGPLATAKIGDLKVQSLEYAYTIQGWLKAINGDVLNEAMDMGRSGISKSVTPVPVMSDRNYARDVIAHSLYYFNNDYKPIGSIPVVNVPAGTKNLYNGNIVQQTTGIGGMGTLQRTYRYDQLQRLSKAENQQVNDATAALVPTSPSNLFKSAYSYDMDGNIKTLERWDGVTSGPGPNRIDNFSYQYDPANGNNKLLQVTDAAGATAGSDLQPGQTTDNYTYDKIGNLIRDKQGAEHITWDRFGKVTSIYDSVSYRSVLFSYDGKGNRIYKEVINPTSSGDDRQGEYYVRDAGGNILSVYRTHSVYSRLVFTEGVIELAGGITSTLDPGVTVLTSLLIDLANSSYPTSLRSLMLTGHSSWVTTFTDRPISFYLGADPTLKSNLLFSGDAWINASRSANPSLHVDAFLSGGMGVQPMFSSALNMPTEGRKLLEQYSTAMPPPVCQPIWAMVQAQYIPGNHVGNATQLYNNLNANPQMKPAVINQLINAVMTNYAQQMPESRNFYNAVVADNTLWLSVPLRGQNGVWTNTIKSLVNSFGDNGAIATFFDEWSGSGAALDACTSPEYKLTAVYESDPNTAIVAMSTEAGNSEIAQIIGTMGDVSMFEFAGKATAFGLDDVDVHAELLKSTTGDTIRLAEHHIYGSSRLGVQRYDTLALANILRPATGSEQRPLKVRTPWYSYSYGSVIDSDDRTPYTGTTINNYTGHLNLVRKLGKREYQLTDHLGNVLATVLDRKTGSGTLAGSSGTQYDHWSADIASSADYYPGGMMMPGRNTEYSWSRHGYNGQVKDDEVYGKGNLNSALFWEMDTRILRRWNVDPVINAWESRYSVFSNNSIIYKDVLGDRTSFYTSKSSKPFLVLEDNYANTVNFINPENETLVMLITSGMVKENLGKGVNQDQINKASTLIRAFGDNYNLDAIAEFADKYEKAGAPATNVGGESFEGAKKFTLNGNPFVPTGEVIANLRMENGVIVPGKAKTDSDDLTGSIAPLGYEGVPTTIHLHPSSGKLKWFSVVNGIPNTASADLEAGPSEADYDHHPSGAGNFRSVVVEDSKIIFHTNDKSKDVIVDKPKKK